MGCPETSGGFGGGGGPTLVTQVPAPNLAVPYEGRLALLPEEPASFALESGALPSGLSLREDGLISGTPDWLGGSSSVVRATLMSGDTLRADLTLTVVPGEAPVFPGFPRNAFVAASGSELLGDLWVRLAGGGEPQTEVAFEPGMYLPGPNELAEGGGGDDARVGDLVLGADASLGLGQWSPSNGGESQDPPTWDPETATFTAGEQAGRRSLSFGVQGFPTESIFLGVVPPDWCPNGDHPRGGPSPGVCE